jgi:hypothetical protein
MLEQPIRSIPLALALGAALLVPAARGEEVLKEKDHRQVGELIAAYMTARTENKGISEALASLAEELDRIKKKLKGRDPLALTADLGHAMWYSQEYEGQKGVRKGRVETYTATSPWQVEYAVHAPKKYNPKEAYPLLLCIPDKGEKPTDHLIEKWIDPELRDAVILAVVGMPEDASMWAARGDPARPGGGGSARIVYGELIKTHAVDFDHVYIAGWGAGVAAAVKIASESPDRFAGVIGRSGDVTGEVVHEGFANLPTFFASAGAGATAFSERIGKAGYGNCTLAAEASEAEILSWMKAHARVANPSRVVFVSSDQYVNKAYWIEVPPAEGERRIEASIDRESNTITIRGSGSASVTLLFNDALVDLDRPVKVVCNGAEHLDQIPRNVANMLELMWTFRSDPGKLYTAGNTYDLPSSSQTE